MKKATAAGRRTKSKAGIGKRKDEIVLLKHWLQSAFTTNILRQMRLYEKKVIVRSIDALKLERGDVVVLSAQGRSIEELDKVLRRYFRIFNRRGIELIVSNGNFDVQVMRGGLSLSGDK